MISHLTLDDSWWHGTIHQDSCPYNNGKPFNLGRPLMTLNWPSKKLASENDSTYQVSSPYNNDKPWMTPLWPWTDLEHFPHRTTTPPTKFHLHMTICKELTPFDIGWPPNWPLTFSTSDDDSTHQVWPPYDYLLGFDPIFNLGPTKFHLHTTIC